MAVFPASLDATVPHVPGSAGVAAGEDDEIIAALDALRVSVDSAAIDVVQRFEAATLRLRARELERAGDAIRGALLRLEAAKLDGRLTDEVDLVDGNEGAALERLVQRDADKGQA